MQSVRIYEMPACKMAASGCGMFGDGPLEAFDAWFSTLPRSMFPRDFLWMDAQKGGFVWYYLLGDDVVPPEAFDVVDFPGGLYAVATGIDGQPNDGALAAIHAFVAEHDRLAVDENRACLGNVITSPAAAAALGYCQMDYYVPLRFRTDHVL